MKNGKKKGRKKIIKKRIHITTDVIVSLLMLVGGIFCAVSFFVPQENNTPLRWQLAVPITVIMLVAAYLFGNDAACLISQQHKIRFEEVEHKYKVLPVLGLIFAIISIPVGAAALFYAPTMIFSMPILSLLGLSGQDTLGGNAADTNTFTDVLAAVYMTVVVLLEFSAFVCVHNIIKGKFRMLSRKYVPEAATIVSDEKTETAHNDNIEESQSNDSEEQQSKDTEEPQNDDSEEQQSDDTEESQNDDSEEQQSKDTEEPQSNDSEEPQSKDTEEPQSDDTEEQQSEDKEKSQNNDTKKSKKTIDKTPLK